MSLLSGAMIACASLTAFISFLLYRQFVLFHRNARRGEGLMVNLRAVRDGAGVSPLIEMTLENGQKVCRRAQPGARARFSPMVGQTVAVCYLTKKVFGREVLNIYVCDDGNHEPYTIYRTSAWVTGLVSVALLIVAIWVIITGGHGL